MDVKRYSMNASNGAVIPVESKTGRWVEYEMGDRVALLRVQEMAEESLDPEHFENLMAAIGWIKKNRHLEEENG